MKARIFAVILLSALILAGMLMGSLTLRQTQTRLESNLTAILAQAQADQWALAARQAQAACLVLQRQAPVLGFFLPQEQLSELDCTLHILSVCACRRDETLFTETERARSQLRALSRLFFRTL